MRQWQVECPKWCETEHGGMSIQFHQAMGPFIGLGEEQSGSFAWANAGQMETAGQTSPPLVYAYSHKDGVTTKPARLDAGSARSVAATIEALADATPEQHREFAASLNAAAGLIDPDPEAEAG